MALLEGIGKKWKGHLYILFCLLIGLMFFAHGAQKMLGWFGKGPMASMSFMWWIGVLEFLIGLGIAFGLLARLSALGGIIIMIGAWFKAHAPSGWMPLQNGGELALMYLAAFLIVLVYGAHKWGLEKKLWKKQIF